METKNDKKNFNLNKEKYILLEKPNFFNSKLNKTQISNIENKISENKNNIWLEQKNTNSTASTTQNSHNSDLKQNNNKNFRCFEKDPDETEWFYRYGRNCYIKSGILDEDELFFKEHLENLTKKNKFNFDDLNSSEKISIYLNDKEIFSQENDKLNNSNNHITFNDLKLNPLVKKNLTKMKYNQMTPIQKYLIPYVLNEKDCLGCAQTGSGKTVAFLTPIISLMIEKGTPKNDKEYLQTNTNYTLSCSYPVLLILVPTRELVEQIFKEARKICHRTGIVVCKCYGGVPLDSQIWDLKQGCDIVIGTPGRIIELIEKRFLYLNLIRYLIIDESDRMLDMGFEAQMNEIILNKNMTEKNKRLNLMFSATITKHVSNLSKKYMNNDCYLITTSKSICDKNNIYNTNSNVEQIIYYVEDKDKIGKLHEIFQEIQGNVIIFMETKKSVDNLENFLSKRNYNVLGIHGDKPQNLRKEAITLFSSGDVPILIATDVASRGLDFPNVSYVFNYDLPKNIEDYIHRIGRTGRVGNKGKAISFYNEKNNIIAENLVIELKKSGANVPDFLKIYDYESNYNNNNNINYYNTYGEENFYYHKNHNNRKFNLNNKKNFYNYKESEKKYYNYNQRNKRKKYNDGHNYWRRNENY